MTGAGLMTVGELSRRTGMPARALRAWTDMGLVYSAGRSPAGYRLYDQSALWCTAVIGELRGLGLTIAEIRDLAAVYLGQPQEPVGPHLAALLRRARDRADARIGNLQALRERIDQALDTYDLAGDALRGTDPRRGAARRLTLPPGASRSVGPEVIPVPEHKAITHQTVQRRGDPRRPRAAGPAARARVIGTAGTAARVVVGVVLLGSVVSGEASRGWHPAAWVLALLVVPAAALAAAWLRARRHPGGLRATGPAGHAVNAAVFTALYVTPWYASALAFTSDAALIFYGASMLLAAARGYAGCEVLAVPNWLLRRDDQVGCVVFAPVDALERRRAAAR